LLELSGSITKITAGRYRKTIEENQVSMRWRNFVEAKDVSKPGERFHPMREFAGWVSPIDVPGHQSVSKEIQFMTEPVRFTQGTYRLKLIGISYPRRKWLLRMGKLRQTRTFDIDATNIDRIEGRIDKREGEMPITHIDLHKT
jgi:hypothetical protein